MTSIEDKLHILQDKVSTLDKTGESASKTPSTGKYTKYSYIVAVYLACVIVLVWFKPSFIMHEEKSEYRGKVVKTLKINKLNTGGCAAIMCGVVIGGWYWYLNKN
tara:strand:+ start:27 stop:341 length:315 start_codon:yes stop_codon:yes gene_type:complete